MFSGYTVVTVVMKASFYCQNKPQHFSPAEFYPFKVQLWSN